MKKASPWALTLLFLLLLYWAWEKITSEPKKGY